MGLTPSQFAQMQQRVARPRRSPAPVVPGELGRPAVTGAIILGIDPALRATGYGVVRMNRGRPAAVVYGTVRCPSGWQRSRCLARILEAVREVIRAHHPTVCVVEGLFYAQNLQTALILGEARGAALAAAAEAGLEIYEIAPRKVKQAVVGFGGAQKLAVTRMVQRLLGLAEAPAPDAADALALALTLAQETGRYALNPPKRV